MSISALLVSGIEQLGFDLTPSQIEQLMSYLELIQKWNKAYNLVGTSNSEELVQKHLLDSLAIVPYVKKSPVLDVGSGAGLPGIPLAISLPDISFTLLDSNGKKARFMRQVLIELKLTNIEIVQARVESYLPSCPPNTVLSRAFAPMVDALELLSAACAPQGRILIMLGTEPSEIPLPENISEISTHGIEVPGLNSKRHLLIAEMK